jgi:hypothetical protein
MLGRTASGTINPEALMARMHITRTERGCYPLDQRFLASLP